jgi:hypothetical protein
MQSTLGMLNVYNQMDIEPVTCWIKNLQKKVFYFLTKLDSQGINLLITSRPTIRWPCHEQSIIHV